ncbi:MAG TPA: phosphoribosyltransferase [Patescibacteria group bacterium]|nr:phosphoribosyltransferase [Patescibacteria group bacterium]
MKKTTVHEQSYLLLTWSDVGNVLMQLAEQIIQSGEQYDRIIALAKGGLTWSRTLCDYLGLSNLSSIQISFYTDIGKTARTPVITQSLPITIQNERVLIFDDLADSGETLKIAKKYAKMHGAKSVKVATLASKTWTKFLPDYFIFTSGEWIIFPGETRETIVLLSKMWRERGDSEAQIKKQFIEIGFSLDEIHLFLPVQ